MTKVGRFVGVFLITVLAVTVVATPVPVGAGPNDFQGGCSTYSTQRGECTAVVVMSKSYTDTHPSNDRAKFTCTKRAGSACVGWVVASGGNNPSVPSDALPIGACIVKTGEYLTEAGATGVPILLYLSEMDPNCNGLFEISDTRMPAGRVLRVFAPAVSPVRRVSLLNLTMVNGEAAGYITAGPCSSMKAGPQAVSSGNHPAQAALANLAVVDLGDFVTPCIYNQLGVHLVVDLQGYFDEPYRISRGFELAPVAPLRLLDTRETGFNRPSANRVTRITTGAPAGAGAALVNLVMVGADREGYITAGPCDRITPGPQAYSSGNHVAATAVSNLSVVRLGADGSFCIYNESAVHLVVDLQGLFVPPSDTTLGFEPATNRRLIDTRTAGAPALPAGSITAIQTSAPTGTAAVLVNLAMAAGDGNGFITADRCSALKPGTQTKSSANYPDQVPISNLSVVPLDPDGTFCIYNSTPVHLIADIQGYFQTSATLRLELIDGVRLIDTRISDE
jgi:hypothetical protein